MSLSSIYYSLLLLLVMISLSGPMANQITAQVSIKPVQTFQIGDTLGQIYEVKFNLSPRNEGILVLHPRRDGTYYFVTLSGLFHWTHDSVYEVAGITNLGGLNLNTSVEDQEGRIWFYLDPFGENVQIANLWSFKPGECADNASQNPLVKILSSGEKIHKIHQLANRTLVFQTNAQRLILYRNANDFEFIDLPTNGTLIGGGEKSIIIGKPSDQGNRISIYYTHSKSWEKLTLQDETSSVDYCMEYNGHLSCISGTAFLISQLSLKTDQWTWQQTPDDLFHFQKSSDRGFFQNISGGNIHTLYKGSFSFSYLLNEINAALPVKGVKNYLFSDGKKWVLSHNGLFFVTLQRRSEFLPVLNDLPDNQISTRGLIELADGTLLAGTYAGLFEINTSAIESGKIEAKKVEINGNCQLMYAQGFHLCEFRESGLFVYFANIHLHQPDKGTCKIFNLRTQQISEIWDMAQIDSSLIMVGSTTGLFLLDMETEEVRSFEIWGLQSQMGLTGISINRIFSGTSANTYWLSTNNGLFLIKVDLTEGLSKGVVLETLLPGIQVHEIAILTENELLVTTMNRGLLHLSKTHDDWHLIQEFNTSNFLSTNSTHSLELDTLGRAWLGTDDGLYHICLNLGVAKRYDTNFGITQNEFNRLASLSLKNGWLVFGGIEGYIFFNPLEFPQPVYSERIGINGLAVNPKNSEINNYRIHSTGNSPSFEIPVEIESVSPLLDLPYSNIVETIFYRQANNSNSWVKAPDRKIPVNHLKPGVKYQLELLAELHSGQLLFSKITVELIPPYKTQASRTLFIGGMAALTILGSLLLFLNYNPTKKKKQMTIGSSNKEIIPSVKESKSKSSGTDKSAESEVPVQNEPINEKGLKNTDSIFYGKTEGTQTPIFQKDNVHKSNIFLDDPKKDPDFDHEFYEVMRAIIIDNIENPSFKVIDLARKMGYSKRTFQRLVKEKTGKTAHINMLNIRLEKTRDILIEDPNLTIAEVTYAVGMNKPSYLSKLFNNKYNISIRSFKARVKNGGFQ